MIEVIGKKIGKMLEVKVWNIVLFLFEILRLQRRYFHLKEELTELQYIASRDYKHQGPERMNFSSHLYWVASEFKAVVLNLRQVWIGCQVHVILYRICAFTRLWDGMNNKSIQNCKGFDVQPHAIPKIYHIFIGRQIILFPKDICQ